jgi:hypothetical protein
MSKRKDMVVIHMSKEKHQLNEYGILYLTLTENLNSGMVLNTSKKLTKRNGR